VTVDATGLGGSHALFSTRETALGSTSQRCLTRAPVPSHVGNTGSDQTSVCRSFAENGTSSRESGVACPATRIEGRSRARRRNSTHALQERRSLRERPRQRNIGAPGSPLSRDFEAREAAVAAFRGSPGDHGVTTRVTPLPRSERGLGDPGDPSCTRVLRKSPAIPYTTRRSSDTRGHRHPTGVE
jgi:hypothetical protein